MQRSVLSCRWMRWILIACFVMLNSAPPAHKHENERIFRYIKYFEMSIIPDWPGERTTHASIAHHLEYPSPYENHFKLYISCFVAFNFMLNGF